MVHGLAFQLGGALRIHSRPGLGTNIELWLPQSAVAPEAAEAEPEAAPEIGSCGRALLVDDEELVRLSTADRLSDLGYEVIEAASAEEAIQLVGRGEPFGLLVTDHLMPGMTRTDLARAVRSARPEVLMLVVSGYAGNEGIAPDLPRLTKPFRKDELSASLAQITPRADRGKDLACRSTWHWAYMRILSACCPRSTAMDKDLPQADLCNCLAIRKAARHVTQYYDSHLALTGLRTTQFSILARLERLGPRTINELAADLVLDRTTLGRNLGPLERDGLVAVGVDRRDRRSRVLDVTEAGAERLTEARRRWKDAQRGFDEAFGGPQAAALRQTLAVLVNTDLGAAEPPG